MGLGCILIANELLNSLWCICVVWLMDCDNEVMTQPVHAGKRLPLANRR